MRSDFRCSQVSNIEIYRSGRIDSSLNVNFVSLVALKFLENL